MHVPAALRLGPWPLLALVLLAPPTSHAQEPAATDAPAAETKKEKKLRIPLHSHRLSLFGGLQGSETARQLDLVTPPVNDLQHVILDMDGSSVFGLRYSYQLWEKWGVEVSFTRASSELANKTTFDRAHAEYITSLTTLSTAEREAYVQRLDDHSGPVDLDITYLDVGAVRVFNPYSRWVAEADFGIGWASGSLGTEPAVFEQFVHSSLGPDPANPWTPVLVNEVVDPTGGQDCPAADDPCVAVRGASGLSWHAGAAVSAVLTEHVHLRLGARFRFVDHVVDPGDSYLAPEASLGLSFVFGGE